MTVIAAPVLANEMGNGSEIPQATFDAGTIHIPTIDVPDSRGGINVYEAELKLLSDESLTLELITLDQITDEVGGVHGTCCTDGSNTVILPEIPLPNQPGDHSVSATLVPIAGTLPLQFRLTNLTLNIDTRKNISIENYADYDPETKILRIPVVDIPDAGVIKSHRAALKWIKGKPPTFELIELKPIKVDNENSHALYDPHTQTAYLPGAYLKEIGQTLSFRVAFSQVAGSNPAQFTLTGITPLPYFSGITESKPNTDNSVKLTWLPISEISAKGKKQATNANNLITYEVYVGQTLNFTPNNDSLQATVSGATEYELTGLVPGITNYILIIAIDNQGNRSLERDYHAILIPAAMLLCLSQIASSIFTIAIRINLLNVKFR
ncbi:hypothetical protein QUF54_04260 [Candidatus Marithioploca araucensis]|uniref:Fibronectin type-III domain-containing protein n=1 Tax=Candidatus Marithioploca araucensis TaxID=70273 RepID=A0ABT7VSI5_9GAMM|nr:hypothetical protein [Candidatus Marithioploca araucensis]